MFYETAKNDHGLPHNPFKAIVAPRPIGWISSMSSDGASNLAPYSFFNAIAANPDLVAFSSSGWKDSVAFIDETGEFVCNYVSENLLQGMNKSSVDAPRGNSEFEIADLPAEQSKMVRPLRVKGVPAALECKKTEIIELKDLEGRNSDNFLVIGQVVGIYINDDYITEGRFDVAKAKPPTRMGYMDYQRFGEIFELPRPKWEG